MRHEISRVLTASSSALFPRASYGLLASTLHFDSSACSDLASAAKARRPTPRSLAAHRFSRASIPALSRPGAVRGPKTAHTQPPGWPCSFVFTCFWSAAETVTWSLDLSSKNFECCLSLHQDKLGPFFPAHFRSLSLEAANPATADQDGANIH